MPPTLQVILLLVILALLTEFGSRNSGSSGGWH